MKMRRLCLIQCSVYKIVSISLTMRNLIQLLKEYNSNYMHKVIIYLMIDNCFRVILHNRMAKKNIQEDWRVLEKT